MSIDVPNISEQIIKEKEALFEKIIFKSDWAIKIDTLSERLNQSIELYQNNIKHGMSPEDPAMIGYAQEFEDATKGLQIDEFLAYFERKKKELNQK